jgi:hypothetical protein
MVTGHFLLGHDLPMIAGALLELGMPPLPDMLVQDTKVHLLRMKGISKSQESLGAMLGLESPKVQMNQAKWRAANRLTPEGWRRCASGWWATYGNTSSCGRFADAINYLRLGYAILKERDA